MSKTKQTQYKREPADKKAHIKRSLRLREVQVSEARAQVRAARKATV